MEQVLDYYKKFVREGFDENGILNKFEVNCPDNYNFGYDIIDKFAELEPNRPALKWTNVKGEKKEFTYGEISELSTRAANLFASKGIKKGDTVMLVLKRNYQFWYAVIGLIKLGAIAIPATHLLTTHDFTYRFEQADVKAIICTHDNPEVKEYADLAQKEINWELKAKFICRGEIGRAHV